MTGGFVAPGFERVRDAFEAGLAEELGAGFAAVRDGKVVVNLWGGWADRAQTRPWAADTILPVYSTTKGVSAIVMAWLVDRGLLNYDATSASVWPAFGAHGKDKVTVAQTLAHQAGVPGFLHEIDPDLWLDPPACAAAIAALEPLWPPGSASGYHPLTWGYIAGELAQRASGRSLGTILREEICAPLGIDFSIGTPESEHGRAAEMKKPSRGGDFGEITPPRKAAFFTKWAAPVRGSTQWRVIGNTNGFYGPNAEAIGHSGMGGSVGFGDSVAGISVGYVMNKQSHHIMGDPRSLKLIDALYSCI
ncbi:MAG: beta-lactamase family protein [Proteobacteria bacterium]|nr:beta-lactamase family protein [Pseudomonadota bacterium]